MTAFPKIKRAIKSFLISDSGQISGQSLIKMGIFVSLVGIGLSAGSKDAGATPSYHCSEAGNEFSYVDTKAGCGGVEHGNYKDGGHTDETGHANVVQTGHTNATGAVTSGYTALVSNLHCNGSQTAHANDADPNKHCNDQVVQASSGRIHYYGHPYEITTDGCTAGHCSFTNAQHKNTFNVASSGTSVTATHTHDIAAVSLAKTVFAGCGTMSAHSSGHGSGTCDLCCRTS